MSRGLIAVRRTHSPDGHERLEVRTTRSGHVRSIPFFLDELRPGLDAARETGYERVFTGRDGGALNSGNLRRAVRWDEVRDKIATFPDGKGLRFHDLRHTFLSRLPRLGVAPAKLQKVAGHASITTTELHTRSSAVEAALSVGEFVRRAKREVTPDGGESAENRRMTGTFDR